LGFGILAALMFAFLEAGRAQTKGMLVYGNLYRIHAGFLELKADENHISAVKVDAATVYWDGKADKAAAKGDLKNGDEIIAEMAVKEGVMVAKKVRFLHRAP
jgi:hypothetical protein